MVKEMVYQIHFGEMISFVCIYIKKVGKKIWLFLTIFIKKEVLYV